MKSGLWVFPVRRKISKKQERVKSRQVTGVVSSLGRRGHGIVDTDTGRLFVPYALPGETVRVNVEGDRIDLLDIVESAPDRTKPRCAHFGACGGCAVQHLAVDAYKAWKRGIVEIALRHQGLEAIVDPLVDAHGIGRRRVTFHVRRRGDQVHAGFMKSKSHEVLNVEECPVLEQRLMASVGIARRLGDVLLDQDSALDVRFTSTDSGLICNVLGRAALSYDQHMDLVDVAEDNDLARLSLNGETLAERRKPYLSMGRANVVLPADGFLQATVEGEDVLAKLVADHVATTSPSRIADLFCGIGPYTLRLADGAQVFAADSDASSVAALGEAVRHTPGLKQVSAVVRDLFVDPLSAEELNAFDVVVFNPPRAGAGAQVAEIAQSTVSGVVAVSCDPATFSRDARVLVDAGYDLTSVTPVDQFKWAAHVELVAHFHRPG